MRPSRLVRQTNPRGFPTQFVYDRTRATFGDGAFTEFVYDAAGRLVTATDSLTGAITEEYDLLNRLFRETTPQGSIQYAYDASGRRTTMTVNGQAPVSYAYDAVSRLTQLAQAPLAPVTINYDAAGRRTLLRLPNGVTTAYDYDAASRLIRLTYTSPSTLLGDLTYQYDAAGNRTSVGGSFARTLLPEPVPSATYDAANQQLAFGTKTMTYDQNGNLASLTEPTGTTSFTWDSRNRLVALSRPDLTAGFSYDALGRRTQKVLNGRTSQYHYDGEDIIREIVSGAEASYLRSLNIDETLARTAGTTVLAYLADSLGSTVALADPSGALVTTYTYEPFGRTVPAGTLDPNPFAFTGRERDGADLYYYRARYYHPGLQRFISEDPIGFAGGEPNFYAYLGNNPVNDTDPLGLQVAQGISAGIRACLARPSCYRLLAASLAATGLTVPNINPEVLDRAIDWPERQRRVWTCTCRADCNDNIPGNCPQDPDKRFAFGRHSSPSYIVAKIEAKRNAIVNLGCIPKHIQCKCIGPNGERRN